MKNYAPTPGSTPFRVIAHLESLGDPRAEVSTGAISAATGVPCSHIATSMDAALRAGLIFSRKKGGHERSPIFWSLVDHSHGTPPPPKPPGVDWKAPAAKQEPGPSLVDELVSAMAGPVGAAYVGPIPVAPRDVDTPEETLVGGFAPTFVPSPDVRIDVTISGVSLHEAERIQQFVQRMRAGVAA